ncbi:hypothetical protein ACFP2T_17845 [Plantactinospora solaniradicis]|uniref:Uncharacterized protein n=1 Tax=Plantactinospora solaniradicis TaxID=1723736 RepID=A0ABW1K8V9_9ACTN
MVDEMPRQDRCELLGEVPPSRLVRVGLHDVDVVADGIRVGLYHAPQARHRVLVVELRVNVDHRAVEPGQT